MNILAIGAHPDDVELGCAGMLLINAYSEGTNHILVMTGSSERRKEAEIAAEKLSATIYFGFLDDMNISEGYATISILETHIKKINPDVILINSPNDSHQDHRNLAKAVISAARYKCDKILFYETPSTISFIPNYFKDISFVIDKKCEVLSVHKTQKDKIYTTPDSIKTLARYRAQKILKPDKYIEAYEIFFFYEEL